MPNLLNKTLTTTADRADLIYVVRDPGGTPLDRRMTIDGYEKSQRGNESNLAYASLSSAITAIGSTQATLEIPATTTVSASLTVPANVTLLMIGTGIISVASGQTLTVNGPVVAPMRQIFTGLGSVKFGGRVGTAYPEWFGAVGDNTTDDQAAIQKAIDAFKDTGIQHHPGVVELIGGYAIGSTVTITGNSCRLRGSGIGVQNDTPYRGFIRWIGSAGSPMIDITEGWYQGVESLRIIGKSSAKPTAAIRLNSQNISHGLDTTILRDLYIGPMFGYDTDDAIQFDVGILKAGTVDGDGNLCENIQIEKCTTGVFIENPNASMSLWLSLRIGACTTAFKTAADAEIHNALFGNNGVDFAFDGPNVNLQVLQSGSEGSTRLANVDGNTGCCFAIKNGSFQCGDNFTPADSGSDRNLIIGYDVGQTIITLDNFRVLTSGSTFKNPIIRVGHTGSSGTPTVRLIDARGIYLSNLVMEPTGSHFPSKCGYFESLNRTTSGVVPSMYFRQWTDSRRTEDRVLQDWRVDMPGKANVFGGPFKIKQHVQPTGVTATATGSGATTYSYKVVAVAHDGTTSEPSSAATCTNTTLDSTHYNTISHDHNLGAENYKYYGRTNGGPWLFMATKTAEQIQRELWFADDGSITPSGAIPTVNTTGNESIEGGLHLIESSPAQITANQNDYAITSASVQRLNTDASRDITGIVAPLQGRLLAIINVGAQNIVLKNQDANSSAVNRFLTGTGADITLGADDTALLWYDTTTGRWRVINTH